MTRILLPACGLALLAAVLWHSDLGAVWRGLQDVGWLGVAAVVAIHALSFQADVLLWLMAYDGIEPSWRWCARFCGVRLIGEAINNTTPLASMGGEPVKAKLLKDRYAIPYTASGVAFLVAKTANLLALVMFLAVGFGAMLLDGRFAAGFQILAGAGLAALSLAIVVLYLIQHTRVATRLGRRLAGTRFGPRLQASLAAAERFDAQLVRCYRQAPRRFATILGLAFLTWLAGIVENAIILAAAGHPVTLLEAWIMEAVVQLVRTAAFFIPGGLGAVELGFVVVVGSITGSPTLGVVVAVIRRFRDLLWIGLGVAAMPIMTRSRG